jgi:hypothetical protein
MLVSFKPKNKGVDLLFSENEDLFKWKYKILIAFMDLTHTLNVMHIKNNICENHFWSKGHKQGPM